MEAVATVSLPRGAARAPGPHRAEVIGQVTVTVATGENAVNLPVIVFL